MKAAVVVPTLFRCQENCNQSATLNVDLVVQRFIVRNLFSIKVSFIEHLRRASYRAQSIPFVKKITQVPTKNNMHGGKNIRCRHAPSNDLESEKPAVT